MREKWKPITGYECYYEVSNEGNVRSLARFNTKGKMIKPIHDKDGYLKVCLSKNNIRRTYFIHRLVANEFVKKTDPTHNIVNHKNEIKTDNNANNLEWCDVRYNNNYNGMQIKRAEKKRKPLIAIKGDEVLYFGCAKEAAETLGISRGNIIGCLHKSYGRKTLKGYRFEYGEGVS